MEQRGDEAPARTQRAADRVERSVRVVDVVQAEAAHHQVEVSER